MATCSFKHGIQTIRYFRDTDLFRVKSRGDSLPKSSQINLKSKHAQDSATTHQVTFIDRTLKFVKLNSFFQQISSKSCNKIPLKLEQRLFPVFRAPFVMVDKFEAFI